MIEVVIIIAIMLIGLYIYSYKHRLSPNQYIVFRVVFGIVIFGYLYYPLPKKPYLIILVILPYIYNSFKDYKEMKELGK